MPVTTQPRPPAGAQLGKLAMWAILGVVLLADALDMIDATVTNIAAPAIVGDIGGGASLIKWLGASYALAMAVPLVIGGRLGDRYGQRRLFLIGMSGFTLASAVCGLDPGPNVMIVARILKCGFGALLIPQGMAIISRHFTPEMRRTAFNLFGPLLGIATIGGPVLAGLVIDADFAGLSMFGLIEGSESDRSLLSLMAPTFGVVFLLLFVRRQRTASAPLIEPSLFGNKGFTSGLLVGLMFFAVTNGLAFVIPLFIQQALVATPGSAAVGMLPLTLGIIAGAGAGMALTNKLGRTLILVGMLVMLAGAEDAGCWLWFPPAAPTSRCSSWPPRASSPASAWAPASAPSSTSPWATSPPPKPAARVAPSPRSSNSPPLSAPSPPSTSTAAPPTTP